MIQVDIPFKVFMVIGGIITIYKMAFLMTPQDSLQEMQEKCRKFFTGNAGNTRDSGKSRDFPRSG